MEIDWEDLPELGPDSEEDGEEEDDSELVEEGDRVFAVRFSENAEEV